MSTSLGSITVRAEYDETGNEITTPSDITSKYEDIGGKLKEHFYTVFLNNDNQEIGDKLIGLGGCGSVQFDIRDIARTAVLVNASAVILVHNHPSGNPTATSQDIKATQETHEALDTLGIQLLDHVIITRNDHYSMKNHDDGPFNKKPSSLETRPK